MTKHPHAEKMLQFAQDAAKTAEPHKLWQSKFGSKGDWRDLAGSPSWDHAYEYRRKLKEMKIGNWTVTEPMTEFPELGRLVWIAAPTTKELTESMSWNATAYQQMWLKRGLVHADKDAAIRHAKVLIAVSGGEAC